MDINNSLFLQLLQQRYASQVGNVDSGTANKVNTAADIYNLVSTNAMPTDSITLNGKTSSIGDISSVISDEALIKAGNNLTQAKVVIPETMNTTLKDLNPNQQYDIKVLIYNLHHTGGTGGTGGTGTPDGSIPAETPDPTKKSFIDEFNDTTTLFEYMHSLDPTITLETGITKSQLITLTQNDDWENNNNEFFGTLNRIFSVLDKNNSGILSSSEVQAFIGNEIGDNANTFNSKINTYAQQIQQEYLNLPDNQAKLEYLLDLTEEYMTAAGLTEQLQALNRLRNLDNDTNSTVHVGQISLKDLNPDDTASSMTLGQYMSLATDDGWYGDSDGFYDLVNEDGTITNQYFDGGMFLDSNLINSSSTQWYELVDVLVHEITHATAFLHQADETIWGEYVAYQVDEDYLDSIGLGLYNGFDEKSEITNHINSFECYDGEPIPAFKWWSYA